MIQKLSNKSQIQEFIATEWALIFARKHQRMVVEISFLTITFKNASINIIHKTYTRGQVCSHMGHDSFFIGTHSFPRHCLISRIMRVVLRHSFTCFAF